MRMCVIGVSNGKEMLERTSRSESSGLEPCLEVHNGFILVNYKHCREISRGENASAYTVHSINMPKKYRGGSFLRAGP